MEWFKLLNWDTIMHWLNAFVTWLSPLLASAGVPEEYRSIVAFGFLYLGATVVVLLFVFILLKIFGVGRKPPKDDVVVEADVAEVSAEAVESTEVIETQPEAEIAPTRESEPTPEPTLGLFERFKAGLSKTQSTLVGRVDSLLRGRTAIDADLIEELEEILITADLGMQTTQQLIDSLESSRTKGELASSEQVRQLLMEELTKILSFDSKPLDVTSASPFVIMVIGVNGVGKTTTIGKLANQFALQGKKVILGAGDTFRAAAAEQLQVWGERADVEVISHTEGADPSAVAFDAAKAAVARKADILLLDTAGRLHTKVNLMAELKKMRRVLDREIPGAPHEVLLVLDATTGQNALTQAKLFNEAVDLDGIVLTKLDGTAKGGIVVAIAAELQVPVRFVGIGEQLDDLRPFDAEMFVSVLFDR
ncbi:signal recognition particle-docking protein FtsY [Desulfuromusa kysingii]|uniref:Signal recognition particle receptor FtsY n=2 Tax=Desulfuromusa kysingii TaxID=37625 RepID=A0A1H3WTI4_9BACT|nr:signal recognition particle-docking protein FtsY [Desulfuromusa kysingii]